MPRPAASTAILAFLVGAVFASRPAVASAQPACLFLFPETVEGLASGAETIVVATVREADAEKAVLAPEAFLKGPVTAGDLVLRPTATAECRAEFHPGERVLALLNGNAWPHGGAVYRLLDGDAVRVDGERAPEQALIDDIRGVTEQYAVPPRSAAESQGIDWWKTVVPVGAAVIAIFIAGLFLMRIWHRIDPS